MDQVQSRDKKYYFENEQICLDKFLLELKGGQHESKLPREMEQDNKEMEVNYTISSEVSVPSVASVAVPAAEKVVPTTKDDLKQQQRTSIHDGQHARIKKQGNDRKKDDGVNSSEVILVPVTVPEPVTEKLASANKVDAEQQQRTSILNHYNDMIKEKEDEEINVEKSVDDGANFVEPVASTAHKVPNELARENMVHEQQPLSRDGGNDEGKTSQLANDRQPTISSADENPRLNIRQPRQLDSSYRNDPTQNSRRWRTNANDANEGSGSSEELVITIGSSRFPLMPTPQFTIKLI